MSGCRESLMLDDALSVKVIISTDTKNQEVKKVRKKSNQDHEVICSCGKVFIGKNNNAKHCSDECRKVAARIQTNAFTARNREKCRQQYRDYYEKNTEYVSSKTEEYRRTPRGKLAKRKAEKNKKERFPEQLIAKVIVKNLINSGALVRQPCEKCGVEKAHGHHDDYSKPEEVRWLCAKCHAKHHKELRILAREQLKLSERS